MVKRKVRSRGRHVAATRAGASRDSDTELRILGAAHAVFVRRGTAGARMQEIADEAGVNKALLHYYFRSKSRLAEAVFQRVAVGVFGRLRQVGTSDAPLEAKVRRIIAIYLEQLSKMPFLPGYVISEINQHPERAAQFVETLSAGSAAGGGGPAVFVDALQKQIDASVKSGVMRAIPARQFLANLISLCVFPFAAKPMLCAVLRLDDRGFRDFIEERKVALPKFFLDALRP